MCTTCSELVRKYVSWCQKDTCVTCTPVHTLVPKTPVTKCMQHSLQKNAHIYIYTHTCTRTHMHTNTHAHLWHCPTRRDTDTETHNLYTNMHTHTYTHVYTAYKYIYTCTCIYVHTCMSVHIHTYTHIRTHIQHVHMYTRKHAWNESNEATARGADVDTWRSPRLFRSTQSTAFGTSNARTGFAAESGQIRKNRTFSNFHGLNLCTSHILVFGCLHGQDVVGSLPTASQPIPPPPLYT